jgi:WD40 repeat protein
MSSALNPRSGSAIIAEAATGQILLGLAGGPNVIWSVAFSSDGTRLATASEDGTAQIFDTATGKPLLTLSGHTGPVTRLAFSPDGTRLATTSPDGTARLWDTVTGQQLLLLYTDNAKAPDLAFSPDGGRLYIVTDQALRVYALKLTDLMALARARVTRSLTPAECQQYLHTATCP